MVACLTVSFDSAGDHGNFNSWGRKEWFYACPGEPSKFCFTPKITHTRHNMFIGPAGYNMDHDVSSLSDGSSALISVLAPS